MPCNATKVNQGRTRNLLRHSLDKWRDFVAYNIRDVEVEVAIQQKLSNFPVTQEIWEEYWLDQEINDRGIEIDMILADSAVNLDEVSKLGAHANKSINTTCFTSKIKCGNCGKNFRRSGKRQGKNKERYHIWTCRNKSEKGVKVCNARNIPESALKKYATEVLGLEVFDEQIFIDLIEEIVASEGNMLQFKFYGGKEVEVKWTSTARKDYWTPEVRRAWSERNKRKESRTWNGRTTEFTGFVVCGRCGANYRRQSVTSKTDGTIRRKWHCSNSAVSCNEGKSRNCIYEENLKVMVAKILGIPTFNEPTMDEKLSRISIIDTEVTFHFKDGHDEVRTFEIPKKKARTFSEEERARRRLVMKKRWEEKNRGKESNNDTGNNH